MFVENFRKFFPVFSEKHDLDMSRLEQVKTYIKTISHAAKLVSKDVATPFVKAFSFLNYLSFENKKFKNEDFWNLKKIELSEKGFNALEEQGNMALQPLWLSCVLAQVVLHHLGDNEIVKTADSYLGCCAFITSQALLGIYLVRKGLSANKSLKQLKKTWTDSTQTTKAKFKQLYDSMLDVNSFVLKVSTLFAPPCFKKALNIACSCINLAKAPKTISKTAMKTESAKKAWEEKLALEARALLEKPCSLNEFILDYKRLYQEVATSNNSEVVGVFKDVLLAKKKMYQIAPAA